MIAACGRLDFEQHEAMTDGAMPDVLAAASCGSTVILDDPFSDTAAAPLFTEYTSNGMTTAESGGYVSFVFAASVGTGRYSGYDAAMLYPSVEFCATVEIGEVPVGEGLGYFNLVGGTQKIEFIAYQGKLEPRIVEAGMPTSVGIFPLDLGAQKFWRLRHHGGTTYWDVSADNVTFVNLSSTTFWTQAMATPGIGAGAVMTATNAGQLTVQQIQITTP